MLYLFADNSIWISGTAGASVVIARLLFVNLVVYRGVTLLLDLSAVGTSAKIAIYTFGKRLHAGSRFAKNYIIGPFGGSRLVLQAEVKGAKSYKGALELLQNGLFRTERERGGNSIHIAASVLGCLAPHSNRSSL